METCPQEIHSIVNTVHEDKRPLKLNTKVLFTNNTERSSKFVNCYPKYTQYTK